MKERPDELAAHVFEAKFEMRVLVDGVMAAVKGRRADVEALLVGDFVGIDQARGIAGARGGDGGVEGMAEGVAQSDARRPGFDATGNRHSFKHAGLRGHVRELFYTEGVRVRRSARRSCG